MYSSSVAFIGIIGHLSLAFVCFPPGEHGIKLGIGIDIDIDIQVGVDVGLHIGLGLGLGLVGYQCRVRLRVDSPQLLCWWLVSEWYTQW